MRRAGGRIKVRIVKGANLAMERVEAELRGWPQAPYTTKAQVDANFKRLLDVALRPEHAAAVRVGVASHNLFDVGWALAVREALETHDRMELEMLEGMANPQALATRAAAGGLLLYAPIVRRDDFEAAVAYLVRRLDENTAPENFLRRLFSLQVGSPAWDDEAVRFRQAVADRHHPAGPPRRTQDRAAESERASAPRDSEPFANEPDTDFTSASNRAWVASALASTPWRTEVPAVVDGHEVATPMSGIGIDPSAPGSEVPLYRYVEADLATVERAVARGQARSRVLAGEDGRRPPRRPPSCRRGDGGRARAAAVRDGARRGQDRA